jgi:putative component of membrane protein insertase Oxa1/YidC/SpoIIIJ protein YidD
MPHTVPQSRRAIIALLISILLLTMLPLRTIASGLTLVRNLAEEKDWTACRLELDRASVFHPEWSHDIEALRTTIKQSQQTHVKNSSWLVSIGSFPVKLMVRFYRFMVAPALGSRCSLSPSCSAYSLEAARKRGWLGLPMTGDRLIREPTLVSRKQETLIDEDGNTRVLDPICNHIGFNKHTETEIQ